MLLNGLCLPSEKEYCKIKDFANTEVTQQNCTREWAQNGIRQRKWLKHC